MKKGRMVYEQKAAKLTVVNSSEEIIYQAVIFRQEGSYRTTPKSRSINGITDTSLQDPSFKHELEVAEEVDKILRGKLVIGIGIENDFQSLGIPFGDFDCFDMQSHWFRKTWSPNFKPIVEPLGLRSLCKYFFKIDIQPECIPHEDAVDACWTMYLFKEAYAKQMPLERESSDPTNEIQHYKSLYSKLVWNIETCEWKKVK